MKVNLTKGEGKVEIGYGNEPVPDYLKESCPNGLRSTTLTVILAGAKPLTSKVVCHSGDQFVKRAGRYYAFLELRKADNEQACQKAMDDYKGGVLKSPETEEGLAQAAKAHYQLSREDRSAIFKVVCPEFSRNSPERRAQREKALFERLKAKFESQTNPVADGLLEAGKTIKMDVPAKDKWQENARRKAAK